MDENTTILQNQRQESIKNRQRVRDILNKHGLEEESERTSVSVERPKHPSFPTLMFGFAAMKDMLDVADLSIIGMFITYPLSVLVGIIIFVWIWNKVRYSGVKKQMVGWLWRRYALAMIVEFIPGFKLVPANMILIAMAHYKEKKLVQLFDLALDEMLRSGMGKYIK